jgi:ribose-phosphate pyrophosphokinase
MLYINGQPLEVTRFPDGTSQVWKLPESVFESKFIIVKWEFAQEGELLHLAQLKDLLDVSAKAPVSLVIKYLPYGRQDKNIANDATFALHSFAILLNRLNFFEVVIMDPHSDVALKCIKNAFPMYPVKQVEEVIQVTKTDLLCYPDAGALKKYTNIYEDLDYIWGEKDRDQSTGNILSYKLVGDPQGKNVLIVDDLVDGGMTFKLLAKDLLAAGAKEVNLFATHGIFSKGLKTLRDSGIKRIFTQDGEASTYQDQIMYRAYDRK